MQDNDCHWYIIPEDKLEAWNEFCNLDPDDEASWNVPDFAKSEDGPSAVPFYLD